MIKNIYKIFMERIEEFLILNTLVRLILTPTM